MLSLYAAPDQMSIPLNKLPWYKPRIFAYMRWQIEISPITTAQSGRFMRVANIYIFDDIGRFSEQLQAYNLGVISPFMGFIKI